MDTSAWSHSVKDARPKDGSISTGTDFIYVGLWLVLHRFKVKYLEIVVYFIVFACAMIEVGGALVHFLPEVAQPRWLLDLWRAPWFHYPLITLLCCASFVLIWHHSHLKRGMKRLRDLLQFLIVVTQNMNELETQAISQTLTETLDALIDALDYHKQDSKIKSQLLNATVLVKAERDDSFRIYAQDSSDSFRSDLLIPANDSVAGKVVKYDTDHHTIGSLLYVPSTRFVHGVVLTTKKRSHQVFTLTEIIPASYTVVDESTEHLNLKCLLCVQIPLKQHKSGQDESYSCAVLSLSGRRGDCLDTVLFTGARLAAKVFAEIL